MSWLTYDDFRAIRGMGATEEEIYNEAWHAQKAVGRTPTKETTDFMVKQIQASGATPSAWLASWEKQEGAASAPTSTSVAPGGVAADLEEWKRWATAREAEYKAHQAAKGEPVDAVVKTPTTFTSSYKPGAITSAAALQTMAWQSAREREAEARAERLRVLERQEKGTGLVERYAPYVVGAVAVVGVGATVIALVRYALKEG
jgi:hypothetical protein